MVKNDINYRNIEISLKSKENKSLYFIFYAWLDLHSYHCFEKSLHAHTCFNVLTKYS